MSDDKPLYRAIGLMSGTSMDGIDAAVIESDGEGRLFVGNGIGVSYDESFRVALRAVMGGEGEINRVERELTLRHAEAVRQLMTFCDLTPGDIDVVGFHGQTILHRPDEGRTWQIGDGRLLARDLQIPVVNDFRSADVAAGGQGAPLAPAYHAALVADLEKPVAVLNLGGIANITWIGTAEEDLLAFDTGPANALLDDWLGRTRGLSYDANGELARVGKADSALIARFLDQPYFSAPAPKSLDRFDFDLSLVEPLSPEDGAATLVEFTAQSAAKGLELLPARPLRIIACGGGRKNPTLMAALSAACGVTVETAEDLGWNGDLIEAQAFGFLAIRSLKGLPLSYPATTGVGAPTPGGVLNEP